MFYIKVLITEKCKLYICNVTVKTMTYVNHDNDKQQ